MALADLKSLLYSEKEWVKVHAAEFLLWEGYCVDEVRAEYLKEEKQFGDVPKYRIGIWRVLAQAAIDEKDRQYWIEKIVKAYKDVEGEDRLHAIETLAKLKVCVVPNEPTDSESSFRLYSLWNYASQSEQVKQEVKRMLVRDLLDHKLTELEILVTSYILRYIGPLSEQEFFQVKDWVRHNDLAVGLRSNLLATLLISCPESQPDSLVNRLKDNLLAMRHEKGAVSHVMMALAQKGAAADQNIVSELYDTMRDMDSKDYNSDLHATAAYMMLSSVL